ncbi:MAG: hypothetical protein QOH39_218, partial [Verrucomicrobiota bacterium]
MRITLRYRCPVISAQRPRRHPGATALPLSLEARARRASKDGPRAVLILRGAQERAPQDDGVHCPDQVRCPDQKSSCHKLRLDGGLVDDRPYLLDPLVSKLIEHVFGKRDALAV